MRLTENSLAPFSGTSNVRPFSVFAREEAVLAQFNFETFTGYVEGLGSKMAKRFSKKLADSVLQRVMMNEDKAAKEDRKLLLNIGKCRRMGMSWPCEYDVSEGIEVLQKPFVEGNNAHKPETDIPFGGLGKERAPYGLGVWDKLGRVSSAANIYRTPSSVAHGNIDRIPSGSSIAGRFAMIEKNMPTWQSLGRDELGGGSDSRSPIPADQEDKSIGGSLGILRDSGSFGGRRAASPEKGRSPCGSPKSSVSFRQPGEVAKMKLQLDPSLSSDMEVKDSSASPNKGSASKSFDRTSSNQEKGSLTMSKKFTEEKREALLRVFNQYKLLRDLEPALKDEVGSPASIPLSQSPALA